MLGGDLNLILNPKLHSSNTKTHGAQKNADVLRKASTEIGLVDI